MNWKRFKDEKPVEEKAYLFYTKFGGWRRARWENGEFTESVGPNRTVLVDPECWAEVELP